MRKNEIVSRASSRHARRGSALLVCLVIVTSMFMMIGSIMSVSLTSHRVLNESTSRALSFYIAGAGLEAAKYELG